MKKALICGAGGFLGTHLARRLKKEGYWVRGVDIKKPEYSRTAADEFLLLDLRERKNCRRALRVSGGFDEVYQLAADRGGIGYMVPKECEMMENNVLINVYMVSEAAQLKKKPKYFYSSSVCVYRDMSVGSGKLGEEHAYPAYPDNEYGWEKLYSERLLQAFHRRFGLPICIARFHTTYGPESNWEGGREKAADALCRRAALARDGGFLEVWGNGKAVRVFTYVDDLISGIRALMKSDISEPTNIGSSEYVTVGKLAETVIAASEKKLKIKYVSGPVGVAARNFSNRRIYSTGWRSKFTLRKGIAIHYAWIKERVDKKYGSKKK
ncbi:NAD-dependent dehydratase [Candidatus Wolfebacteria bacterium RIFCSPHIGHO2_01_FULL_48_22]|uniref:NAD-dependent dehydratase n=2 Tax=Candidatus Wolfeibacteriota TaxID=1752735 RepID=A0A1F8DUP1_9BACT|nr:MAG: NAD-dependent dehydratase [Candidatus Wolfebacteria bacterium RIFCSPHIGHO2_01_FULL_48_22]OGM93934.1 MAG: NAD-dependent dehydratase [Candidatus Wolfebacteria bacterium RIFCSPLOWO2_01_FULL_47_17b]